MLKEPIQTSQYKEVNRTEPSTSVRVPCLQYLFLTNFGALMKQISQSYVVGVEDDEAVKAPLSFDRVPEPFVEADGAGFLLGGTTLKS
jgi:hypothetical protein